jgi:hypothetical protein
MIREPDNNETTAIATAAVSLLSFFPMLLSDMNIRGKISISLLDSVRHPLDPCLLSGGIPVRRYIKLAPQTVNLRFQRPAPFSAAYGAQFHRIADLTFQVVYIGRHSPHLLLRP